MIEPTPYASARLVVSRLDRAARLPNVGIICVKPDCHCRKSILPNRWEKEFELCRAKATTVKILREQQNDSRLTDPQCLVSRIKASSVLIVLIEGYD